MLTPYRQPCNFRANIGSIHAKLIDEARCRSAMASAGCCMAAV
jgi:hypothetical protein